MTTDDIVKALRLCANYVAMCEDCPYKCNPDGTIDMECCQRLLSDAADLIEHKENDEK